MTHFLLVRHGLTSWGEQQRYAGWSDVDLSVQGHVQAQALISRLEAKPLDAIYSSDLARCATLASHLADRLNIQQVVCTHELRESNFGAWEGKTYAEIEAVAPHALQAWTVDPLHHSPPDGETLMQVAERIWTCLDLLEQAYPAGRVLVVTHGGPIRLALCHWLAMPLAYHWRLRIDPASLTLVDTYPEGAIVNVLNDTCHLP